MNKRSSQIAHPSANDEFVVIAGRQLVTAASVGHSDVAAIALLHVFIVEAQLAHQFDTPDFKPDQEIRMIGHAHLVGFGVTHAETHFVCLSAQNEILSEAKDLLFFTAASSLGLRT